MKLLSWNVNGIRACRKKGFDEFFQNANADAFCLQEVKATQAQSELHLPEYHILWHAAEKPGYSGTAVFLRQEPLRVSYDMPGHTGEGRILTAELADFFLVNVYVPNSQRGLTRLSYRMEWQDAFQNYITALDQQKPLVICGDLNVAHQDIDIKRPKANRRNAGFTDEERGKMTGLLDAGFTDTFRAMFPERRDAYTWWSYMGDSRAKNVGWRIDYFLVSQRLWPQVSDARIYPDILGSDHCPVGLVL